MFVTVQEKQNKKHSYWEKDGESVKRPLKPSYKFSLNESYRENGKVKKYQIHIGTYSFYQIVTENYLTLDKEELSKKYFEKTGKILDVDFAEELITEKMESLYDEIFPEYEEMEEFAWKEMEQEEEPENVNHFHFDGNNMNSEGWEKFFQAFGGSTNNYNSNQKYTNDEIDILKKNFKKLAKALHPDIYNGSDEPFKALQEIRKIVGI